MLIMASVLILLPVLLVVVRLVLSFIECNRCTRSAVSSQYYTTINTCCTLVLVLTYELVGVRCSILVLA